MHDDGDGPWADSFELAAEAVLGAVSDAVLAVGRDWRIRYANAQAGSMFGGTPADLLGSDVWSVFPEGRDSPLGVACEQALRDQAPVQLECYVPGWDRWLEKRIHPLPSGLVVFAHEITDRRKAEERLAEESAALAEALAVLDTFIHSAPIGIAFLDRDLSYSRVNAVLAELNGLPAAEHLGRRVDEVPAVRTGVTAESAGQVLRSGLPLLDVEVHGPGADDEEREWLSSYYPVRAPDGRVTGVGVIVREVTEQRHFERLLLHQATRDALTGLPNRALFMDRLTHALSRRRSRHLAVLFVDLDRFKVVNDSLGHAVGDRLLQAVADALAGALRAEDTVARLGGDEFGVLCEEVDGPLDALRLGERLLRSLEGTVVEDPPLHVDCSIGIALAEPAGGDADALLRDADTAMYQAKADGRGGIRVFDARLRRRALSRQSLERRLRDALATGALDVHYQPVVDLRSRRTVAVEALVRWADGERGDVSPAEFIPVAEDSGLIHELGAFVLAAACRHARDWRAQLPAGWAPGVAVNISPQQLLRGELLVQDVAAVIGEAGIPPAALCLEITESSVLAETEACMGAVRALAGLGVELAVDDFGTGYSSLS
ncbi:putative bifunctional diguanylate cyclase/phosphodiesterase, partial [Motilibacter deserti]